MSGRGVCIIVALAEGLLNRENAGKNELNKNRTEKQRESRQARYHIRHDRLPSWQRQRCDTSKSISNSLSKF